MRRLTNSVAEFSPATTVSIVFSDSESYKFNDVIKACKLDDDSIVLELQDRSFAEIKMPYRFYQIGGEAEW